MIAAVLAALIGAAPLTAPVGARAEGTALPAPPLISFFRHWDDHWFLWTPGDPVYESLEVMSTSRGPSAPPLVWAFLTERAGGKRQVHYINDPAIAAATGWSFRAMRFLAAGTDGRPKPLSINFDDQDGNPIHAALDVPAGAALVPEGLTDQSGHAEGSVFLIFFRALGVLADDWQVTISGRVVSSPNDYKAPFRPAYSHDVFVAGIPFGTRSVSSGASGSSPDQWNFRRTADGHHAKADLVDRSEVGLDLDEAGAVAAYRHSSFGHAMTIRFSPALPACGGEKRMDSRFALSLDEHDDVISGMVHMAGDAKSRKLVWHFRKPEWANRSILVSTISPGCGNESAVTVRREEEEAPTPESGRGR